MGIVDLIPSVEGGPFFSMSFNNIRPHSPSRSSLSMSWDLKTRGGLVILFGLRAGYPVTARGAPLRPWP